MKKPNTYTLRIVGSHPRKLPLDRMALYLSELAKLMGEKEKTHFDKLSTGSAALKVWAEPDAAPAVSARVKLAAVGSNSAAKEAVRALERINELLTQDGKRGELQNPEGVVIYPFQGGRQAKSMKELLIDEECSITGQVIKIGGRDETIPLLVKDADGIEYNCTVTGAQLAKEISAYYLGDQIELSGKGKWRRSVSGIWELIQLNVKSWTPLSDDWDAAYASMERLGSGWSNVPDIEEHCSAIRKGH